MSVIWRTGGRRETANALPAPHNGIIHRHGQLLFWRASEQPLRLSPGRSHHQSDRKNAFLAFAKKKSPFPLSVVLCYSYIFCANGLILFIKEKNLDNERLLLLVLIGFVDKLGRVRDFFSWPAAVGSKQYVMNSFFRISLASHDLERCDCFVRYPLAACVATLGDMTGTGV